MAHEWYDNPAMDLILEGETARNTNQAIIEEMMAEDPSLREECEVSYEAHNTHPMLEETQLTPEKIWEAINLRLPEDF